MAFKESKSARFEAREPTMIADMEAGAPNEEPEEDTEIEAVHPQKRGRRAFRTPEQIGSMQALRQHRYRISSGLTVQSRPPTSFRSTRPS